MATPMPTGTRLTTEVPAEVGKGTVWEIDPKHTLVEFSVRHMMFSTVKGRFTGISGTIHCADEADPSRASVKPRSSRPASTPATSSGGSSTHRRISGRGQPSEDRVQKHPGSRCPPRTNCASSVARTLTPELVKIDRRIIVHVQKFSGA